MSPAPFNLNQAIDWVIDWDGTLTEKDTLNALVNIANEAKPASNIPEKWKQAVEAYITDYENTSKRLQSDQDSVPWSIEAERDLLKQMEPVEQRSIDRVSASGIFKDLTVEDLNNGARKAMQSGEVKLRTGTDSFLAFILSRIQSQAQSQSQNNTDRIDILSVNWSQTFIASCLRASDIPLQPLLTNPDSIHHVPKAETSKTLTIRIHANELSDLDPGPSTGRLCTSGTHKLLSSADKLSFFTNLQRQNERTTVYIGDSHTDLECLLAADLGICIRDSPLSSSQRKLGEVLEKLGVRCEWIGEEGVGGRQGLVWARDFEELGRVFAGEGEG